MTNIKFLLSAIECKANHPITCLNPTEWFIPIQIRTEYRLGEDIVFVRGEQTCWFRIDQCEVRNPKG